MNSKAKSAQKKREWRWSDTWGSKRDTQGSIEETKETEIAHYRSLMQQPNTILVVGSNYAGIHGAGAAKAAYDFYGAEWGIGEGLVGRSYAIPTKDTNIKTLPLRYIKVAVDNFILFARLAPRLEFVLSRVGCGLAGYADEEMAPLFAEVSENVILPFAWLKILDGER